MISSTLSKLMCATIWHMALSLCGALFDSMRGPEVVGLAASCEAASPPPPPPPLLLLLLLWLLVAVNVDHEGKEEVDVAVAGGGGFVDENASSKRGASLGETTAR